MSGEAFYYARRRSLEGAGVREDFRGERDILESRDAPSRTQTQRAALAAALQVSPDLPAIDVLLGAFVTPESAEAVAWLPVIQLGWIEGMTAAERAAIKRRSATPAALRPEAAGQVAFWCLRAPSPELYEAGIMVLRQRLSALPPTAREEARLRLLQACDAVLRADGGFLRVRAVSPAERAARHALVLAIDAAA